MDAKIDGAYVELRLTEENCAMLARACKRAETAFGNEGQSQDMARCAVLGSLFGLAAAAIVRETLLSPAAMTEAKEELARLGLGDDAPRCWECGKLLPESASTYRVQEGNSIFPRFLCENCAGAYQETN